MLNFSYQHIFIILYFFIVYFLYKNFILLYMENKFISMQINLLSKKIGHHEAIWHDTINELISNIEIIKNDLSCFSLFYYIKFKQHTTDKEINNFKKKEKEKLNHYPIELQQLIINTKNEISKKIIQYMLFSNLFIALFSFSMIILIGCIIFIKLLVEFLLTRETISKNYRETISKNYDEKYQKYTDKYMPIDTISDFLKRKIA